MYYYAIEFCAGIYAFHAIIDKALWVAERAL